MIKKKEIINNINDNEPVSNAKVEKISIQDLNNETEKQYEEQLLNVLKSFLALSKEERKTALELIKKGKI